MDGSRPSAGNRGREYSMHPGARTPRGRGLGGAFGRASAGRAMARRAPEVRREPAGTLGPHERQRHLGQSERRRVDEIALFEGRIELLLPAEELLEVIEAAQVAHE